MSAAQLILSFGGLCENMFFPPSTLQYLLFPLFASLALSVISNCGGKSKKAPNGSSASNEKTNSKSPAKTQSKEPKSPALPAPTESAPPKGSSVENKSSEKKEPVAAGGAGAAAAAAEAAKTDDKKSKKSAETADRRDDDKKMEDSFEKRQPKKLETARKQEIEGKKVDNKGDYKTWNKVIENSEFNKTLSEKSKSRKRWTGTEKENRYG
ncbi:unnamed protein product [Caenorhabditis auriculariae]|uniref:Uncharacterized protein n=1 Tax=Caenorhabditis auriculariae TaxID=2777116 RepID=A0A8S1GNS6_9PELO|nr:unnamed protein product [Caenorhabditis auriculariae]